MRIQALLFAATAAAATLLSASAYAEPAKASQAHRPSADEARYLRGSYELNDGRVLRVTSERSKVFAEIDGRSEELVPVGERTFATRSGERRVVFDQLPFPTEVTVETAPVHQALASSNQP